MNFGAHVSVAGGLENAINKAKLIGCDVLQIFVSPPQSFRTTDYSEEQITLFKKLYQSAGFGGLFLHAIYLLNLASDNPRLVNLSKESLVHYLEMGDRLGAKGTIVHLGSYKNANVEKLKTQVIESIKDILNKTPKSQHLIVENCASRAEAVAKEGRVSGKIGKSLNELVEINERVKSDRLSFCIDTQHLFASGVDVRDYQIFESWLHDFDERIGIDNLVCIHANDSKSELGSEHDRHENIGEGKIGEEGFRNILNQPLLQNIPFILETPGHDPKHKGPDKENLEKLKGLSRE